MLLTIDIGNTNITLGVYAGEDLGPRWRLATSVKGMPDEYGLTFIDLINHAGFTTSRRNRCLPSLSCPPGHRKNR